MRKTADEFMSDRLPARNNLALSGRIFLKFDIWVFSQSLSRKLVSLKPIKNNGQFTRRPSYLAQYYNKNISDRSCRGNENTVYI